jgi:FG-GAP repeat
VRRLVLFASFGVLAGALCVTGLSADSGSGFTPAADYVAGDGPISVAIGDLNGDGNQDLATANLYGHSLSVLMNRG